MAKELAKPSACFQLRRAKVSLNAGLAQNFLFRSAEKGLKKAEGSEEASALPGKEATKAQLQSHASFSKRPEYEHRARLSHASCK